jgi:hypothetical protein
VTVTEVTVVPVANVFRIPLEPQPDAPRLPFAHELMVKLAVSPSESFPGSVVMASVSAPSSIRRPPVARICNFAPEPQLVAETPFAQLSIGIFEKSPANIPEFPEVMLGRRASDVPTTVPLAKTLILAPEPQPLALPFAQLNVDPVKLAIDPAVSTPGLLEMLEIRAFAEVFREPAAIIVSTAPEPTPTAVPLPIAELNCKFVAVSVITISVAMPLTPADAIVRVFPTT